MRKTVLIVAAVMAAVAMCAAPRRALSPSMVHILRKLHHERHASLDDTAPRIGSRP